MTTVEADAVGLHRRVFFVAAGVAALASLIWGLVSIFVVGRVAQGALALSTLVPCGITYVAAKSRRMLLASYAFVIGITSTIGVGLFLDPWVGSDVALAVLCLLVTMAAFTASPRAAVVLGCADVAVLIGVYWKEAGGVVDASQIQPLLARVVVVVAFVAFAYVVSRNARSLREVLRRRVGTVEEIVPDLAAAGERVAAAATEIHAMATEQSQGAVRQASAVQQTREALHSTLSASRQIAKTAREVFSNAEKTSKTTELSAEKVAGLSEQIGAIVEILDAIKGIAARSEVLALNAALESTRAGDAGRGFKLVANQMQQLAEQIMQAVRRIKVLTGEVRESTQGVRQSMEETLKLAELTTEAGREISLVTQQQQTSTEQVASAMDDIAEITSYSAAGTQQTLASTEELTTVVAEFPSVVRRLRAL